MHAELVLHIIRHIHAASSHCASTYDGFTAQSVQLRRVLHQGNTHLHQHNTHIGGKSCRVGGVLTNARHKPTSPLRKQFPKPAQIGLVSSTIRSYLPATGGIFADMPFVEAITRKHYLRYPSS